MRTGWAIRLGIGLVALALAPGCTPGAPSARPPPSTSARVPAEPYYEYEVQVPVRVLARAAPTYPDSLRRAGVEGTVHMEYVVDTLGRAEPASVRMLRVGQPPPGAELFAAAARVVILTGQYSPAERDGRKVRQVVQQPVAFRRP